MGITSSQGVGRAIRDAVRGLAPDDPLVQEIPIKASGCPNGCGQHHLAGIGLQGSSFKAGLTDIPCFDVFVGGRQLRGRREVRLPRRQSPFQASSPSDRQNRKRLPRGALEQESFIDYVDRVGPKHLNPYLDEFKEVGPISAEIDVYMDWGKDELFKVVRGEGECAL